MYTKKLVKTTKNNDNPSTPIYIDKLNCSNQSKYNVFWYFISNLSKNNHSKVDKSKLIFVVIIPIFFTSFLHFANINAKAPISGDTTNMVIINVILRRL